MQTFRNLANNIFFKIFLAFIALSFVFFGVSGFVLGGSGSWVAKVGGKTIGYSSFIAEMQKNRQMVLQVNKSEEALKYIESDQFKSDVLSRMINSIMIKKIKDDLGVEASRHLILQSIAKDSNFKTSEGKFNHELFKDFLAKNGLDEEKYLNAIQDEVVATMIIQTIALASPINEKLVAENEAFKQEKRFADVVTISTKSTGKVVSSTEEEVQKFYDENKSRYKAPEVRSLSYITFDKKDFFTKATLSDQELRAEYDNNKEQFTKPETRNFYQLLFDDEESAKNFIKKLDAVSDKSTIKASFVKLAKELQQKDLKEISLENLRKDSLISDLANPIFKLEINGFSAPLKSPLGYHVFLLNQINKSELIAFEKVKDSIKTKLLAAKQDKVTQEKLSSIDDEILTANSLNDVAKKFNLSASRELQINKMGQNAKGEAINEIADLDDFTDNAFALRKNQSSKLFNTKNGKYYAIKISDINPEHEKTLAEVKNEVIADLSKRKQYEALQKLAQKIGDEIANSPSEILKIAEKYQLKTEKNKEFPRTFFIDYQGQKIPYANQFLDKLFTLNVGQTTGIMQDSSQEFIIGLLKSIKHSSPEKAQVENAKKEAAENFKREILQEYNSFLTKKYPVKVNDKLLTNKENNQ